MISVEADLHVHTVASGHAYSTVEEITKAATERGLKMVAITDHGPCLPGGAHPYHFWNLRVLPRELNDVYILRGIEANIINETGELDLEYGYLEHLDIVLAGFHPSCGYASGTVAQNTQVLINAMENPLIDVIVHPGNTKFLIDPLPLVDAAAAKGIALEINNSSFLPTSSRDSAYGVDLRVAEYASDKGVPVVLSSDAHIYTQVGVLDNAIELALKAGIKSEQVLNISVQKVLDYLAKRREKQPS